MITTMRLLTTVICYFAITTCTAQSKDFKSFVNNFSQLEFPFVINNEPLKENKILFNKGFKRIYFLKYLNDIKEYTNQDTYFYYGGKTHCKGLDILIYRITNFGDAPALDTIKIELVVFNPNGKMVSKMMIGGQETENKLFNCQLNDDLTFSISIFNELNKLQSKKKYFIDTDGKIKKQ